MGRRSVNTTKSGKYMNPTDQARKEARKRELKKNKKQRMAVRQAVLKSKDPLQLLEEAAVYDKQEYDPNVQAALNERVLQEKRRKLLETFDRLVILYRKEDIELAKRLQAARHDYDRRRHDMVLYYEQVKLAERVKASEIPLPELPPSQLGLITADIPLPSSNLGKGILKKSLPPGLPPGLPPIGRKPPGPPPGTPPELSDSDSEDSANRQRKIRFAEDEGLGDFTLRENTSLLQGLSASIPTSQIPLPPPINLPIYPGMIRPSFPGAPPPMNVHSSGHVLSAPPSLTPRQELNKEIIDAAVRMSNRNSSFTDNANSSSLLGSGGTPNSSLGTIIQAKPQLKNLIGDATRFVPTSLKVRRTTRDGRGRIISVGGGIPSSGPGLIGSSSDGHSRSIDGKAINANAQASKDDAYEEFMREMETLL